MFAMKLQPTSGTKVMIAHIMAMATATKAIGRRSRRMVLFCSVRFPFAPEILKV
jgi:hypothetical protein